MQIALDQIFRRAHAKQFSPKHQAALRMAGSHVYHLAESAWLCASEAGTTVDLPLSVDSISSHAQQCPTFATHGHCLHIHHCDIAAGCCTCLDFQKRQADCPVLADPCKHLLAVRNHEANRAHNTCKEVPKLLLPDWQQEQKDASQTNLRFLLKQAMTGSSFPKEAQDLINSAMVVVQKQTPVLPSPEAIPALPNIAQNTKPQGAPLDRQSSYSTPQQQLKRRSSTMRTKPHAMKHMCEDILHGPLPMPKRPQIAGGTASPNAHATLPLTWH